MRRDRQEERFVQIRLLNAGVGFIRSKVLLARASLGIEVILHCNGTIYLRCAPPTKRRLCSSVEYHRSSLARRPPNERHSVTRVYHLVPTGVCSSVLQDPQLTL
jgi:exosome complex RNA-binding protein Rrp4